MDPVELLKLLLDARDAGERRAIVTAHRALITQEALQTWKGLAQEYARAGDERQALRVAEMIALVGRVHADDAIIALGEWTFGNVCVIVGRGNDARSHYQAAGRRYRALGDWKNLARMSVGVLYQLYRTGEYDQAFQVAREIEPVLAASDEPEDCKRLASVNNNLGMILDRLGRYEEALERYEQKIAIYQDLPSDSRAAAEIARARINVGVAKKHLNLWAEAELALEAGRKELAQPAWKGIYRLDLARAESHLADLLARRGAPPDAVKAAFARYRALLAAFPAPPQGLPDLLHLDLFEAEWQLQTRRFVTDFPEQLAVLRERAAVAGQAREMMRADLLLADYQARHGDTRAAIASCAAVRKDAQTSGDWEMVYRAWYTLGRIYEALQETASACESFRSAVAIVEATGRGVASGDLRSGFLDDKLVVYQDLVRLHLDRQDLAGVLHWTERARARELVEMLAGVDPPRPVQPQSKLLLEQLAGARNELAAAVDSHRRRAIETRITDLSRQIAALEPRAREWLTGETAAPSALCAALPAGALMLVYTLVRDTLWVLPLTRQGLCAPHALGATPSTEEIERDLDWLQNLAGYPQEWITRHAAALVASARRPLAAWYDRFLAPLSALLARHQQLIIVPDGPLFRLPFHACYNSQAGSYLVETHQVSYTPSATAWLLASQREARGQGGLVLAYAGDQLHHTVAEVEAIRRACPDFAAYMGPEATAQQLQGRMARQAAFIHLAAHAVFCGDNPLFSRIELADGSMETLDVLRMRLYAALVVLSACRTGRGLLRGGEYLGLARAFLLAGARSVLVSHWAVDDATTAELMRILYRHLADGNLPGEALRQAQLKILSSAIPHRRHPYYWAPFFLLGASKK